MKFEPLLDKYALRETLRKAYGYPVSTLAFLPEGEVGCHYIAECEDGKRYFVTLLTGSRLARFQVERLDFTLALTRHLFDAGLFRSLVPPLRTLTGSLHSHFQGCPLILYEHISGGNLAGAWPYPSGLLASLGRLTAQLHGVTPVLGLEVPFIEHFTIPFEADLRTCLAELEAVDSRDRPGRQTLRDLLLPRREMLFGLLDRLHALGMEAQALHPPLVLVHTDLTPSNILHTPAGGLIIVDWEGAMLAPAEHDLVLFACEGYSTLLANYIGEAGKPRLYPQLFAYYFYRRNLEDLTDFLVQILHENTIDAEDRHDLEWLELDCLSGLPFLEKSADWAMQQLESVTAV
jgi:Ser/Thr protein kinase RdoA (MazF antagonist)